MFSLHAIVRTVFRVVTLASVVACGTDHVDLRQGAELASDFGLTEVRQKDGRILFLEQEIGWGLALYDYDRPYRTNIIVPSACFFWMIFYGDVVKDPTCIKKSMKAAAEAIAWARLGYTCKRISGYTLVRQDLEIWRPEDFRVEYAQNHLGMALFVKNASFWAEVRRDCYYSMQESAPPPGH